MTRTKSSRIQTFDSQSPKDTQAIGARLGQKLKAGDVVLLFANLGGGKTTFAQGLLKGLGVKEGVLSPTFILAQTFYGRRRRRALPVHHLDFYRLNKKEILGMGIQDYFTGSGDIPRGVVMIEWPERLKEIWPEKRVDVRFELGRHINERTISIQDNR